ncbi:Gfo/Idh/MocA family protein [Polyangium mundeleinium]|uniref:Gfo/Idh/MocA family oxidoreductase n=1 Tax=Polyangium mundeleinium TaxID=2995306 RepID=A0ABT5F658_9BACT|nr:Gfo/Idh/MocA family oxidoreductase [Polyangium mundeleinium]MDC0749582.1 Gfo/Idh/MocA family oxidoreductase [Polyangium mundeleinium]
MSKTGTSKKIRVGIVGANPDRGWASHAHLPALQALPAAYEITAVSTTRQTSADEAARRFGVPHAFDRAELLIEHPEVDLVVVSVRAPLHAGLVRAAIAAKKHVFCEWPLGVSLDETAELARLAESAGVRTFISLQRRFAPGARYLRDLLAEGYVGKVRSVDLHVAVPYLGAQIPQALAYTTDVKNGASTLSILTAHYLDTVLAAVGDFQSVSAVVARQFDQATIVETGETLPVTVPDQVLISGTLQSGAVLSAHIEGGKRNGGEIFATITGTEGDLRWAPDFTVSGARGDGQPLAPLKTPERYRSPVTAELHEDAEQTAHLYAALAKDLAEGTEVVPTFRDAWKLYRLIDALAVSSATGKRVEWKG